MNRQSSRIRNRREGFRHGDDAQIFCGKHRATAVLTGDEFSHAKNVLRLREGDEVVLLDGSGREYDAVINEAGKREMLCTVLSSRPSDKEPGNAGEAAARAR